MRWISERKCRQLMNSPVRKGCSSLLRTTPAVCPSRLSRLISSSQTRLRQCSVQRFVTLLPLLAEEFPSRQSGVAVHRARFGRCRDFGGLRQIRFGHRKDMERIEPRPETPARQADLYLSPLATGGLGKADNGSQAGRLLPGKRFRGPFREPYIGPHHERQVP